MNRGRVERPPAGKITLTYDDYLLLPADGRRYQILEGDIDATPAPSPRHQEVLRNLAEQLLRHLRDGDLGKLYFAPIDVVLDRTNVVQPDLIFVCKARLGVIGKRGVVGAPDLVIEVLSPGTAGVDRGSKARIYASHGVASYWIVDPDAATLEAYELRGDQYAESFRGGEPDTFAPALFPGLAVALADVIAS